MNATDTILQRGVDKIYPSENALRKVLESGRRLRVYQGFDPTSVNLHLGHMVGLRKLRHFQLMGHEVIFLIGDFTATIGDPTGKDKTREILSRKQVMANSLEYQKQTEKILLYRGNNPVKIKYNSQWLDKLTTAELMKLLSMLSYQQIIERDMFQRRIKKNQEIRLSELLYPVLQGYDSLHMEVDVEIGGTDQLFNMLVGRELLSKVKKKEKFIITTPLLTDEKNTKIGKTTGNVIALSDKPENLYGQIMSLPDSVIVKGLEFLTDYPMEKIVNIAQKIKNGENPMPFKKLLSSLVVSQLNSQTAAKDAQIYFENIYQKKSLDVSVPILKTGNGTLVTDAITAFMQISRSEVKRLLSQQGVDINGKTITSVNIKVKKGDIIKVGKHHTFKIA